MSKHRWTTALCSAIVALTLVLTALLAGASSALEDKDRAIDMGYENKLFDDAFVHTIDIQMSEADWAAFLENATTEEYQPCTLVIDGESFANVGLRAKGNTSLSSVASYGNDRYSFKAEFDSYNEGGNYYGLDKLVLNNNIQDNTLMKDYLSYKMMAAAGAAAPLASYVWVTVNGEDWGLYLALEGVEDSFLLRNYGVDSGELYKPDSISMGGGRGNGRDFDMEDFAERNGIELPEGLEDAAQGFPQGTMPGGTQTGETGEGGFPQGNLPGTGETGEGGFPQGSFPGTGETGEGGFPQGSFPGTGETGEGGFPQGNFPGTGETGETGRPQGNFPSTGENGIGGNAGAMNGMGSSDVSLIYSDADISSYANIFESAKTAVSRADKYRLIAALKRLNEGTDIEQTVEVGAVIAYFVAHNFTVNFDSYTGSMIHNYYLYEQDGVLTMLPWDYNLAFGGFQGASDATALANYPIDTPVSSGTVASRPMLAWIFAGEEYTALYHEAFSDFIESFFESGEFQTLLDGTIAMLSPYVERDVNGFCSYEEFLTGTAALREFCLLRAKSIRGQLAGAIPSTSEGQAADSSALVDASGVTVSDMGGMGNMGGGMGGSARPGKNGN